MSGRGEPTGSESAAGSGRSNIPWWRRAVSWPVSVMVALAYLPALLSSPGRMPADSKLYLYLDPGRLIADAAGSFDPRQFAGWVPHQHVSFIWPAGPWFWVFDTLGVPDWVAHRLWIGTLMVVAGLGVRWCARQLGLNPTAALVAAVVYQVSPYVLPYVSRTSVMLLPWAGLGWIVGLTVRATRERGWRDPALIALVVLTVGAVNATALAMIVPAPAVWLVHATWARLVSVRTAATVAWRTAVLSVGVSLWWIAALLVQGRFGTDVLPYSESLADVSHTSTAPEVWRGLGYWLFYIRDPFGPATTESLRYLSSSPAIVVSFALPIVCMAGLVWVGWAHRRFAMLLVATGFVLAVGVHPVEGRSPLMRLLTGDGDGGLALALRSSTRALPVMQLGLALAAGSLVGAVAEVRWRRRSVLRPAAFAVCVLAVVNQPGILTASWVDPAIDRDEQPPAAWLDAADHLDVRADGRVLMLPGAEFGAYRWGYTVDQPLPGLTEAPVVTRDLLPLGSAAAMDLLYAFDDRFQNDVAEPGFVATIARLFAADVVWLTNDHAHERFRTARPEVVRDVILRADGIAEVTRFGAPETAITHQPVIDERSLADTRVGEPLPPVELVDFELDAPLTRSYRHTLAVAGSADGVIDSAAAGLIPDDVGLRYVATDPTVAATDIGQIITDSNRQRARHWRSSQDATGFTEAGPDGGVLTEVASDARLPLFEADGAAAATTAQQRGGVSVRSTAYGEPFAYLPEVRPAMAVDGDPTTAWLVGEHGDPVGETIELSLPDGQYPEITLRQPAGSGRRITRVEIATLDRSGGSVRHEVELDPTSWSATGQVVPIATSSTIRQIDITVLAVGGGLPGTASAVSGVGFSEIDVGLDPVREVVVPPTGLEDAPSDFPTAWVFTRERVDQTDRWRSDPEPALVRELATDEARVVEAAYTIRIDPRSTDIELAELFDWPAYASTRLTGSLRSAGVAAVDGDPATAWITAFGEAAGAILTIEGATEPIGELALTQPMGPYSSVTAIDVRVGDQHRMVEVRPDADGRAVVAIEPPLPAGTVEITLSTIDVATTVDRRHGDTVELPSAVSEIVIAGAPRAAPVGSLPHRFECRPVATIGDEHLSASLSTTDDGWLDGAPIEAVPCHDGFELAAGTHEIAGLDGVFTLDRIVVDAGLRAALSDAAATERPVVSVVDAGRFGGTYSLTGCSTGCVFVFGEGHNDAWTATLDGTSLGDPEIVDGGFNGWWVPPSDDPVRIEVRWTAQRPLTLALVASGLVAVAALLIVVRGRRSGRPAPQPTRIGLVRAQLLGRDRAVAAIAWPALGLLLIGPSGAFWGAIGGVVLWCTRRRDLAALTALATVSVVGAFVATNERRWAPLPNGGWPVQFEQVHDVGVFAVVALLVAAIVADDVVPTGDDEARTGDQ